MEEFSNELPNLESDLEDSVKFNYASVVKRFTARLIEVGIFSTLALLLAIISVKIWPLEEPGVLGFLETGFYAFFRFMVTLGIVILFEIIYEVIMIHKTGSTLGKKIMKIKVVSIDGTATVSLKSSIFRVGIVMLILTTSLLSELIIPNAGGLILLPWVPMLLWRRDGRSVMDLAAKTVVISTMKTPSSKGSHTDRKVFAVLYIVVNLYQIVSLWFSK